MSKLSIVGSLIDKVADRVDEFTLDKSEKAQMLQEINKAQIEVNKVEAGQGGLLVRWRPFLGWVLSMAFAYHFVFQPLLIFIFAYIGLETPDLTQFDVGTLLPVLGGMLGIGGLRSYEETKGLTK